MIEPVKNMILLIGIRPMSLLTWIVLLLLVDRPTNSIIKNMLLKYKPAESTEATCYNSAGAFIGTIERIVVLVFLSVNQYSAIGLILTAKSIARYQKITENKEFAEYYLLGTLLSVLLVITYYLLLF